MEDLCPRCPRIGSSRPMCVREPQTPVTRFTLSSHVNFASTTNLTKMLVCCSLGNENNSGTIHVVNPLMLMMPTKGSCSYAVMRPRKSLVFVSKINKFSLSRSHDRINFKPLVGIISISGFTNMYGPRIIFVP